MNASSKTLFATALIAIAGSAGLVISAEQAAAPKQEIVKLERVVVTAKRAADTQIVQLPRVVIEGRRAQPETQVAMASKACSTEQTMC